jgi:hypothetical protein
MHKNTMKCNKIQSKWCIKKHGASKIIDTFKMYHMAMKKASDDDSPLRQGAGKSFWTLPN